ncbi:aldehyde ferredoxin oxidoreductase family protein [Desulforhopalus singaporensis]|uniref:Aldehyde:ferredoxin oxidoreductase n=1 Tax=Desulforhopalus singaporensis TaxID=91360 RepID=A0A1H0LJ60_9BACT|nr:aldehyde ferredoxin oxidoreductase family protein [Desulforhopalus singaporensis]SDO68229.1 aldehyde:ferredoxin oxidoreductase [Desulforhopalus singaporensis]
MNLYAGRILHVDLTKGVIEPVPLRQEWLKKYWGGWGLALRYFWETVSPGVNPLSPDNAIVIMTGPFCATAVPMTSRLCLVSKSPQTGTVFQSNIGGGFGPELKLAGFDGISITGRADKPVFLKIVDDRVTLEDASEMAGMGILETEKMLEHQTGLLGGKTLSIGPAGENLIPFSIVGSESYRQFGRGGSGALFGSKNLKGIICRGTGAIKAADMTKLLDTIAQHKSENLFQEDNLVLHTDGSACLVDITNEMGVHPTKNYTEGLNENSDRLNADAIKEVKLADRACNSCPIACGKFTKTGTTEVEGPEYETLCLGGSNCGIDDLPAVILFNRICDDLGMDTMSCGSVIALAMELGETGRHDFGLRFGNIDGYISVLREIANLSTVRGKDLAMGSKKLAAKYQAQDLSAEVKGMDIPAYEPRANYGMGIAYATSERGACHLRAFTVFSNDPFDLSRQVMDVIEGQNFSTIKWSMGFCDFWATIDLKIIADFLSVGLGEEVTQEELKTAGERIWNLARLFNVQAGFSNVDDVLPKKMMSTKLKKGAYDGNRFSEEDFGGALSEYYRSRLWNEKGVPEEEKLEALGLTRFMVEEKQ